PAPVPLRLQAGVVKAGVYTTTLFKQQLTLHLGDGWRLAADPKPTSVELSRDDARDSSLNFYVVDEFIEPKDAPGDTAAVRSAADPLNPAEAASGLQFNSGLDVSATA